MTTSDFDYYLPEHLIAQTPLEKRDSSRLLVLDKKTGKITHRNFTDIIDYLEKGDTLVLNKTFSINNTLSSSMPAIKFDENTLITFNGGLNIHYFNILDIKTMQFIAKIYLNYNYFNRINAFKLPDGNILILMNNITFSVYDGVSYNLLMKRYYIRMKIRSL